ncbi:glycosyltransferase family 2 protein [Photobacterium leiognathi]|uniref:glycosyltransferase family 2 protein n=1 Tax=Photobacterium leiognathi TaxID=553611 RepID=UPI002738A8B4|nr:glycosyltransferase [Photobacterium leiognathi]
MLRDSLVLLDYLRGMLLHNEELWLLLFPTMIMIELPLYLLVLTGIFRWSYNQEDAEMMQFPSISFVITCYSEGDTIGTTIDTLVEQVYPGYIEILAVVDGAIQNQNTYQAALNCELRHAGVRNRKVRVIPKWQRGGRVSTLNAGLSVTQGEIVINVDGDTSFDNDMVFTMMKQFTSKDVIASGGTLRVRNHDANILTKMQSLEYMLSMQASKTGMAQWGVLNNISGAFGAFRKNLLKQVGGWDTHTAEDLDLTIRLKQYKQRYPNNKLAFATHAIGHTDVPDTLKGLVMQRLRWDGDLLFLFLRKHNEGLSPSLLGWGDFLFILVYGVVQNVLLPLLVVIFIVYILIVHPFEAVLALILLLYLTYLFLSLIIFIAYIGLVSERGKEDLKFTKWLFIYPVYQFFMRLITAFATVNELVRRSHEESSMAPWWVLKRGKKF